MNAARPLLDILSADPQRAAVCEPDGRSASYAELLDRVVSLCAELRRRGMAPGDRVILQVPNGIEFAATALATLLVGAVPVLLEPGLGEQVYLSRLRACSPKWLLVHPLVLWVNRIPGLPAYLQRRELDVPPVPPRSSSMQRVVIDRRMLDRLAPGANLATFTPAEREPHDDAILIFTGGTTSEPTGVRLSHGAIDHYLSHIHGAIAGMTMENFLADTPQQVLYALRLGKTAYITRGRKQKRAKYVLDLIRRGAVDAYFGSPYIWMEMMAQAGGNLPSLPASLKTVLLGGAPVTRDFLRVLRAQLPAETGIGVLYGMTEAGPVCSVRAEHKLAYEGEGDLVGAPLGAVRLEIDKSGTEDGVGEVIVHSPSLYTGYLGKPERAANEGLRTGDLGRMVDVNGTTMLALLGRAKDMIIRNGVNIYPLSFEAEIRAAQNEQGRPILRECAMIGLWNTQRQDEDVVLCLEPTPGIDFDFDSLKGWAEKVCGTDAKPDHFVVLDSIPVTGRQNKVDKKALRRICAERLGLQPKREKKG